MQNQQEQSTENNEQVISDDIQNNSNLSIEDLQNQLNLANGKINELTKISQQALADLQNFKKRSEEEKGQFVLFANSNLINDILPVLDNINRALNHIPEDNIAKEWANGVFAILKQLKDILIEKGLEEIITQDQNFDPQIHEALMTENGDENKIIKELQKGYKFHGKVIRRSQVTVGNGLKNENNQEQENS